MTIKHVQQTMDRTLADVHSFVKNGTTIMNRHVTHDTHSIPDLCDIRTAAIQFRQAATALDQLDGLVQGRFLLGVK